jgi:hypothetical protein
MGTADGHQAASGVCQDTRRSKRPSATTTLIHLASPDSTFRPRLNPVEPPWYETRMPGGVGGAAPKAPPIPIIHPSQTLGRALQMTRDGRNRNSRFGMRNGASRRSSPPGAGAMISVSPTGIASVAANPCGQPLGEAAYRCPFRKLVGVQPSWALKTVEKC